VPGLVSGSGTRVARSSRSARVRPSASGISFKDISALSYCLTFRSPDESVALREERGSLTVLDSPEDPSLVPAWRPSARRRITVLALTLAAVGLAIAVVATGPSEPVTYAVRLPLLVLAGGALANASQWRRGVRVCADEVLVRSLVRVRRIPLRSVATVETDGCRVTIRMLDGRKAVVRAVTGPSAADDLADTVVTAAGPAARLAVDTPSESVPMATPWLVMLAAAGAALLAAVGYTAHPALVIGALGTGAVASCAVLGSDWLLQRRERTSEARS
jgi:hypothetical protein